MQYIYHFIYWKLSLPLFFCMGEKSPLVTRSCCSVISNGKQSMKPFWWLLAKLRNSICSEKVTRLELQPTLIMALCHEGQRGLWNLAWIFPLQQELALVSTGSASTDSCCMREKPKHYFIYLRDKMHDGKCKEEIKKERIIIFRATLLEFVSVLTK